MLFLTFLNPLKFLMEMFNILVCIMCIACKQQVGALVSTFPTKYAHVPASPAHLGGETCLCS